MIKHPDIRADRGGVLVWVALLTTVLLGVGALAVDLGYAYSVKRQLSVSADAAALAGAHEAGLKYDVLGGCGEPLEIAINAAVATVHAQNAPQGSVGTPTAEITCGGQSVSVEVTEASSLGSFFGRILGVDTLSPNASATAEVFGSSQLGGLRPLTVCLNDLQAAYSEWLAHERDSSNPAPKTYQTIFGHFNGPDTGTCNPTGASGNWGYASFDVGGSQPTLLCLIQYGYGPSCGGSPLGYDVGTLDSFVWSAGNTGNSLQPSSRDKINALLEQPILLPVADDWRRGGSNAEYQSFGGVGVQICGWVMPKNTGEPQAWNYGPNYTGVDCWEDGLYYTAMPEWEKVSLVIQWKFVHIVQSYVGQDSSARCTMGPGCIPVVRLTE